MPPYTLHFSLLPIEIESFPMGGGTMKAIEEGATLGQFLEHFRLLFEENRKQAKEMEKDPKDSHCVCIVEHLRGLKSWLSQVGKTFEEGKGAPSSQEIQMLEALSPLIEEIESILTRVRPALVQKRGVSKQELFDTFRATSLLMQKKALDLFDRQIEGIENVDEEKRISSRQEILSFFDSFLRSSSPLIEFIHSHLDEWNTLVLKEGRSLLIEEIPSVPYPLLFSIQGECYPFFTHAAHMLGMGLDKIVFRTFTLPKGHIYALNCTHTLEGKVDKKSLAKAFTRVWQESLVLLRLRNREGILQMHERFVFSLPLKMQIFLAEDYFWDGSLAHYLDKVMSKKAKGRGFSKEKQKSVIRQLLQGLVHIHEANIVHHDIKPNNILIDDSGEEIRAVIADFQMAVFDFDTGRKKGVRCKAPWAPPEYAQAALLDDDEAYAKTCQPALDVWNMGLLLYMFTTHSLPKWTDRELLDPEDRDKLNLAKDEEELDKQINLVLFKLIAALPEEWVPETAKHSPYFPLLRRMLTVRPEKRCSAKEALEIFNSLPS